MVENRSYCETEMYGDYSSNDAVKFNWQQPSEILRWFLQLAKNPYNAIRALERSDEFISPLILILINLIAVFIASILCVVSMRLKYGAYMSWVHIPYAGLVLAAVFLAAAFDFGLAGLLYAGTNVILKEKVSFCRQLSIVGGKVVIDSVFILAGSIFMLFGSFFFFIFITAGNILSFTILILLYNEEIQIPNMKRIYVFCASLAIIIMAEVVFWRLMSSSVFSVLTTRSLGIW